MLAELKRLLKHGETFSYYTSAIVTVLPSSLTILVMIVAGNNDSDNT